MKTRIKLLVEGGKATAGPPLGPALGPLAVNVGEVVTKINERTAALGGLKVPVVVTVDRKTKEFEIEVGSPPVAVLIKKESGLEKGAKLPGKEKIGNLTLPQAIQIARAKACTTLAKDIKEAVKEVLGTCVSMGITVDGKDPREVQRELAEGKHAEEMKCQ